MDDPSQLALSPPLRIVTLLLVGASIAIWLLVVARVRRGLPVLPYQSRRQVPWRAAEVLLVFAVFEFPLLAGLLWTLLAGQETSDPTPPSAAEKTDVQHPIVDLLAADSSAATWLLCALVAVVVAPIVEEFTYRLVLQGWLEAEERRARRRTAALRRLIPGVGPVVLVSLLFALRHFRSAAPALKPEDLRQIMVLQATWSLMTLGFGGWLLRTRSGATAADLGFVPAKLLADVRLGLLTFAAITAPVLALQVVLKQFVLPDGFAADPIPLFFLALALATVYYRTHRIVPAITTHMAFNATALVLAWFEL
ncbi:MAG TPA: CPBP family glutamic-type intramembrane protease [Thermoguttaceae bacterium]|nr:CPBP family glutamic-type intramembrane protease [Thermoguttaceae bacterium]